MNEAEIHSIPFDVTAGAALAKLRRASMPDAGRRPGGRFRVEGSAEALRIQPRRLAPAFVGTLKGEGAGSVLVGEFKDSTETKWVRPFGAAFLFGAGVYQLFPLLGWLGAIVAMGGVAIIVVPIGRSIEEGERAAMLQWIREVSRTR